MPIAAIPAYLGKDFKDASPGMRFGMYLPIWTERSDQEAEVRKRAEDKSREGSEAAEILSRQGMDAAIRELQSRKQRPLASLWDKNDFAAKQAWKQVTALSRRDKDMAANLIGRQRQLASVSGDAVLILDALSTAPFTTGLGNEHPLENGFAFLNPYGLPYLPGSGVKGVLRKAAHELASGVWGNTHGWSEEKIHQISRGRDTIDLSPLDALFGLESNDGETQHVRGALTFWDVIPQVKGDSLAVEIMTPHQSHYYQQREPDLRTGGSTTPHDSGQPIPISFLTVPPGSGFSFHVTCDLAHLERLAPDLTTDARWKPLLTAAFEHAFQWLGFGAKTAVGYGSMQSEAQRQQQETDAAARKAQEKQLKELAAAQRQAETAIAWPGAQIKFNRANGSLSVKKEGKEAIALAPKGRELLDTLPADVRKKIESGAFVKLTAYVSESALVRVEAA